MLISCKCSNFVASSNTSRSTSCGSIIQFDKNNQSNNNRSATAFAADSNSLHGAGDDALIAELINAFLQQYKRNSIFYTQSVEMLKQVVGPLAELSVTIHQRDLIYKLCCNSWIISVCINCNTAVCAKNSLNGTYLINSNLLTSNEELAHRKADKSYSDTFGILIMNHHNPQIDNSPFNSISNKSSNRVRLLTQSLQSRLQKEIADTDERILRYEEQQFALLKSFREKSEQEYQILVSLVNQVPEQMNDAMGAVNNAVSAPTTPTALTKIAIGGGTAAANNSSTSAMDSNTQVSAQSVFSFNNKKVTSLDTPPATPDSTPMSVGNSPTFNRQQQTVIGVSGAGSGHRSSFGNGIFYMNTSNSIGVGGVDSDGDCLFELEGVESYTSAPRTSLPLNMSDVEESAEDAEDALAELEAAIPIPGGHARKHNANSFAKSLPIAIANSVTESTIIADSDDDILDDNVDIAASIKALAKSVHGETVFGDLPRPRLRTQI